MPDNHLPGMVNLKTFDRSPRSRQIDRRVKPRARPRSVHTIWRVMKYLRHTRGRGLILAYAAIALIGLWMGCSVEVEKNNSTIVKKTRKQAENNPFHEVVENGSLAEVEEALRNGADVNSRGWVGKTALMVAIEIKDLEKVNLLLTHGADPELTDNFNATALRRAVDYDFVDGVKRLLELGVDRGHQPKYPLKKVFYDLSYEPDELEVPADMKGIFTEAEWKESQQETAESIREMGENPTVDLMINDVLSIEVLRLFLAAGDNLDDAPAEVKRLFIGLGNEGEFQASLQEYKRHKYPVYGSSNPEAMNHPFWRDMVRLGVNAYQARERYDDTEAFDDPDGVWCFERFGSSLTRLEDGRFVQIGGEHEDHYDSDFHIYNDVVVHDGMGGFEIFGYSKAVFQPTDFHSATLVDGWIYIIGCIGYPEQSKAGFAPVYRLSVESWRIEELKTTGEKPGWLHGHRAVYMPEDKVIRVDGGKLDLPAESDLLTNTNQFELSLETLKWRLLRTGL